MNSDVGLARETSAAESKVSLLHRCAHSHTFYLLVLAAAAFLIVISRRPDAVFNAQFFAEDGQRWYADAYHFGLRCLLIPDEAGGYLHSAPRLAALLSLLVPFRRAPLVMNLSAIMIQVLPAIVFASERFSRMRLWIRLLGGLLYLSLPNSYGTNANATNIQWHLAVLAFLVLAAQPTSDWRWRIFDATTLVLMSVESPVGVLLAPVAAALWWLRRNQYPLQLCLWLLPGAILQTVVLLTSHARQVVPNGASVERLISIVARQVFLASLLGKNKMFHMALRYSPHSLSALELTATVIGLAILAYALRYAPWEFRLFVVFAFSGLGLALVHPIAGPANELQWELLRSPGTSNRYFYLPVLAFLSSLLWITVFARSRTARGLAAVFLLMSAVGMRRDWRYPPFEDMHFRQYASEFEKASPGTRVVIPINPPPWNMELLKH
ncbi:MAG TPA: hypothetical protein VJO35_05210 [Terriglobales bacterium]|nr:hypothetical protein [Terriglobales bacterium]